jgi:hypothetical protein
MLHGASFNIAYASLLVVLGCTAGQAAIDVGALDGMKVSMLQQLVSFGASFSLSQHVSLYLYLPLSL